MANSFGQFGKTLIYSIGLNYLWDPIMIKSEKYGSYFFQPKASKFEIGLLEAKKKKRKREKNQLLIKSFHFLLLVP